MKKRLSSIALVLYMLIAMMPAALAVDELVPADVAVNEAEDVMTMGEEETLLEPVDGAKIDGDVVNQSSTPTVIHKTEVGGAVKNENAAGGAKVTVVESTIAEAGADVVIVDSTVGDQDHVTSDAVQAMIGTQPYTTLVEAVAAAKEGETVKLVASIEVSLDGLADKAGAIVVDKNITLDGGGHTVKAVSTGGAVDRHVILVQDGVDATIQNLTVDGNAVAKHGIQAYTVPGAEDMTKLTLNNVTSKNHVGYGLLVNASAVDAYDLVTEGNGWGGVNVDAKTATAIFGLANKSSLVEENSIVIEGQDGGTTQTAISDGVVKNVVVHEDSVGENKIIVAGGTIEKIAAEEDEIEVAEDLLLVKNEDGSYGIKGAVAATDIEVTADKDTIKLGETATLTVTVKPEDTTDKITFTSSDPTIAAVDENGKVEAVGPGVAYITVKAGDVEKPVKITVLCDGESTCLYKVFDDANLDGWYHSAIDYVLDKDIMKGDAVNAEGKKNFRAESDITRAEVMQILYRLAGEPEVTGEAEFTDIEGHWGYKAICWGAENGITNGYQEEDGTYTFRPNREISRQELAAMLYRYTVEVEGKLTGEVDESVLDAFPDVKDVEASWAKKAMAWAVEKEIIDGAAKSNGEIYLDPNDGAWRGMMAQMVMKLYPQIH